MRQQICHHHHYSPHPLKRHEIKFIEDKEREREGVKQYM